jgi:hypothetical protein
MKTNVMNGVARKIRAYMRGSVAEEDAPRDKYSNELVVDVTA